MYTLCTGGLLTGAKGKIDASINEKPGCNTSMENKVYLQHSAGTLLLNNRRFIGCLVSFICSTGFNCLRYIGSAGKARILDVQLQMTLVPVFFEHYNKSETATRVRYSLGRKILKGS